MRVSSWRCSPVRNSGCERLQRGGPYVRRPLRMSSNPARTGGTASTVERLRQIEQTDGIEWRRARLSPCISDGKGLDSVERRLAAKALRRQGARALEMARGPAQKQCRKRRRNGRSRQIRATSDATAHLGSRSSRAKSSRSRSCSARRRRPGLMEAAGRRAFVTTRA